jgi:hypothetical protein
MIAKQFVLNSEGVLTTWWMLFMLCVDTARHCSVGHLAKLSCASEMSCRTECAMMSAVKVQRSYDGGNGTACAEITT